MDIFFRYIQSVGKSVKRYLVKNCSPLCKLFDFFRNESSHLICARTILLSFIFILVFFFVTKESSCKL